jgi:hypothetical protein
MPNHHRKVQFSTRLPLSMDISEIAGPIENGLPETFWTMYLAVFVKLVPKSQNMVFCDMGGEAKQSKAKQSYRRNRPWRPIGL